MSHERTQALDLIRREHLAANARLAADWHERAYRLDRYAAELRRDGYHSDAMDAQQAASDYRTAADELEL